MSRHSQTEGTCYYCNEMFPKNIMKNHIYNCNERKEAVKKYLWENRSKPSKCYHIEVDAYDVYWLHIEVPHSAKLSDMDKFIRNTWVDCCGHTSIFKISGQTYSSYPEKSFGEKKMLCKISNILSKGLEFTYEYDYMTAPTKMTLKVLFDLEGEVKGKDIKLMAQNKSLEIPCSICFRKAEKVCIECVWNQRGYLCLNCAREHKCGPELLLPVVNSPRMGVCKYMG